MNDVILIRPEHIEPGKKKYQASRDETLEKLLKNGDIKCEVFRFVDGRILTVHLPQGFGLLYLNEEIFYNKIIL